MMPIERADQVWAAVRLTMRATTREPLGLLALLAFLVGFVGYLALRDSSHSRVSLAMFLVMCWGALSFAFTASNTRVVVGTAGDVAAAVSFQTALLTSRETQGTVIHPSASAVGTVGNRVGSSSSGRRLSTPITESPASHDSGSRISYTWIPDGEIWDEVRTADHRCPDVAATPAACAGQMTTTYRMRLRAGGLQRLSDALLRCVEGPCIASSVNFVRVSSDRQTVDASFNVWDGPSRWRLTARRETRHIQP
jgi:hypothetical protein